MSGEPIPTSLSTVTKGWEIEASVNMENVQLKVYQETKEDKQTLCWVPSEAGKASSDSMAYSITLSAKRNGDLEDVSFDSTVATVLIDDQECASFWLKEKPYTMDHSRVDATHVREWIFSQPVSDRDTHAPWDLQLILKSVIRSQRLNEEDGPARSKAEQDLGTIVIEIRRAQHGPRVEYKPVYEGLQDSGTISEKTKKGILGAVTTFRDKQSTRNSKMVTRSLRKPEDTKCPMWTFRINYAPEAVLQAQGRIPIKHNIARGQAGLNATAPIELDDEPGLSARSVKEKKPKIADSGDENEPDATEAALLAELERHRAKKRKQTSRSVDLSAYGSDNKAAVAQRMNKKLRARREKEKDGGQVDLTLLSD
ncbi:hypothetical protein QFC21_005923 [Naganishia friedmannii]|uniref:Uncharacterized protein n=1 Tax=Naganishia friedmannii TaxID=89922 RepID=A0ACC2V5Z4_9TREE|nr:hypothetical protein QFC21_005923 [Naganishia friedmannii]